MEPSRFYRQHHMVEAPAIDAVEFRPFYRIRTRLDQLLIDNAITYPEWRSALAFRTLAEIVLASTWPSKWIDRPRGGNGFDRALSARHDAMNRLQAIHRGIGAEAFGLLSAHVVEDWTWDQLAQRLGVHPRTARRRAIGALQSLASLAWR